MKRLFFLLFIGSLAAPVCAAPQTQVSVNRPRTAVSVVRPSTSAPVSHPRTSVSVKRTATVTPVTRPATNSVVSHPATSVSVAHPVTSVSVSRPVTFSSSAALSAVKTGAPGGKTAASSYSPSYKNAKDLKTSKADSAPKASQLTAGQSGLGIIDPSAAQKAALAAASDKPKAESSQMSIDEVLQKTNLPSNIMGKLKQRNFEASRHSNKK